MLIISATKNNNQKLAESIQNIAGELNIKNQVICLEDFDLPVYTPTIEGAGVPDNALKLAEMFITAKSVVVCAPEYNGSIPPIVSNAISWISRSGNEDWRAAFNGKFAVVATHSGGGGLKVLQAMRAQLEHLGMVVLPRVIQTNYGKEFNPESVTTILSQLKKYM